MTLADRTPRFSLYQPCGDHTNDLQQAFSSDLGLCRAKGLGNRQ